MNKGIIFFILIFSYVLVMTGCSQKPEQQTESATSAPGDTLSLWNGRDFAGWEFFLTDSLADPLSVWSVRNGNLYCSGVPAGYIRTADRFSDYRLIVEWRWPEEPGNSGVLLHAQKPDKVWPVCIEAQLMSENAGDFYLIGGTTIREQKDPENRRVAKLAENSEFEPGEWNRYDILCQADSIHLAVNGVVQNTAGAASVKEGHIAFQSEGKPIEFRTIQLLPLE